MQDLDKYRRFIPITYAFSAMSKYPGTHVGAIILGPAFEVRSSGWNGAPRACKADEDGRLDSRATRLAWAAHAEANAIANAARTGTSVDGCFMLVTHHPCMACAKLIVQSGIKHVMCPLPTEDFGLKWKEDILDAKELFRETGVGQHVL